MHANELCLVFSNTENAVTLVGPSRVVVLVARVDDRVLDAEPINGEIRIVCVACECRHASESRGTHLRGREQCRLNYVQATA